jgi:CheY-like chemotaxis protein
MRVRNKLLLACLLLLHASAWAQSHTLGVLAFRPIPVMEARWQPLVDYLNSKVDGLNLKLRVLNYPDLEAAIAAGEIHFVLTNPGHFILLGQREHFSSPLASLITLIDGQPVRGFGGVILVPAGREDLRQARDLRGKTIAAVDTGSLGGYQMQAYELRRHGPTNLPRLSGRVLIVEDNPTNRMVIDVLLKRMGIVPLSAENGQEAVDRVVSESDRIDAILMDIHMPVLDGYAATGRIRAWEKAQQRLPLPIVALTADAFAEDRARCLAAGMDDYLSKPVHMDALAAVLGKWLSSTGDRNIGGVSI